jgi:hypothetical protein
MNAAAAFRSGGVFIFGSTDGVEAMSRRDDESAAW